VEEELATFFKVGFMPFCVVEEAEKDLCIWRNQLEGGRNLAARTSLREEEQESKDRFEYT